MSLIFAGLCKTRQMLSRRIKAIIDMDRNELPLDQIALGIQEILDLYVAESWLLVYDPIMYTVDRIAPLVDVSDFEKYLAVCRDRNLSGAAVLAALSFQKLEAVQDLIKQLPDIIMNELVWYLHLKKDRWSCMKKLIEPRVTLGVSSLLVKMASSCLNDEASVVFRMLLERCSNRSVLNYVVEHVVETGFVKQFEALVISHRVDLRKGTYAVNSSTGDPILIGFIRDACRMRRRCILHREPGADLEACVLIAARWGLFTGDVPRLRDVSLAVSERTVMGIAANHLRLDIVRLLHSTGAAGSSELFQLSKCPALKRNLESDTRQRPRIAGDIATFLADAARTPRSLESLCMHEINVMLGYGAARIEKLDRIVLPRLFKRRLDFEDAIQQFKKGRLCRPGRVVMYV